MLENLGGHKGYYASNICVNTMAQLCNGDVNIFHVLVGGPQKPFSHTPHLGHNCCQLPNINLRGFTYNVIFVLFSFLLYHKMYVDVNRLVQSIYTLPLEKSMDICMLLWACSPNSILYIFMDFHKQISE